MNLFKSSRIIGLAMVPMLAVGLFLVLQSDLDKDTTVNQPPSSSIIPDRKPGPPSIIPGDRDSTKIEYRNISFTGGE